MKFKLKHLALLFSLAAMVLVAPVFLEGCAGTPNRIAYQGAVIQRTGVETGLGLFNEWVKVKKAKGIDTTATQIKVQAAFKKWQAATLVALQLARENSVATSTNTAGQTGFSAVVQDAINNAAALKADFFDLLLEIGVSIPGVTPTAATFAPLK